MRIAAPDTPEKLAQPRSADLAESVIPLTRLRVGQSAVVHASGLDAAATEPAQDTAKASETDGGAAMLRAMGLTPEAKIRLCRLGEPCIVAVRCACGGQTRIGLARRVASRIMVQVDG